MRQKFLSLLLVLALAAGTFAQQAAPASSGAPNIDRLRATVTYLASDTLEGRRTGTPGADAAATYIATEMQRLGLKTAPPTGKKSSDPMAKYQQLFPYVAGVELGKGNSLSYDLGASELQRVRVGTDWMPLGFSSNATVEASPVVFVGYGLTVSELKYDDYAGADVKGKIVIALAGVPDGDNPHGQFAGYTDTRWKAIAAKDKGARALVLIATEPKFTDDRLTALRYDNMGGEAGLPVIGISQETAVSILKPGFPALTVAAGTPALAQQLVPQKAGETNQPTLIKDRRLALTTDVTRTNVSAKNIVGVLEGSDPKLKSEVIVIGAHYDHLGRGGEGSLAPRSGDIHHGADDNASGVAGMLELARIFSAERKSTRRTIVFIAFSGEEEGLIGSNYYVNHPLLPLAQTVAMINMDMIGRLKDGKLTVGGIGTSSDFRSLVTDANIVKELVKKGQGGAPDEFTAHDLFNLALSEDGFGPSDHSSFYSKQVPVLFLFTGTHDDYHKPTDTADKINYEGQANIVGYVADLTRRIDKSDARPVYTLAKSSGAGRGGGFKVYLGTIPNYADSNDGLLLDGVRDDSPAAAAGLKAGDKIVRIATREIKNVYDYTYALGELKAGETYEVEVLRDGARVTLKIVPAARK